MTEITEKQDITEVERESNSKTIDIRDLYIFEPKDLQIDISETYYSNLAYIQVAPRDVVIDFLGLPGTEKDDQMVISGARVFMSHVAAQRLVESLGALLENEYKAGRMDVFELPRSSVELTTKITRSSEEKHT